MFLNKKTTSSFKNWWLAFRQPPVAVFAPVSKKSGFRPRVKYASIKITQYRTIKVSVRQFRTSKHSRSKKYSQLVIPIYFLPAKEVAIRQLMARRVKKSDFRLPSCVNPVSVSYGLISIGVAGTIFFSAQYVLTPKLQKVSAFSSSEVEKIYNQTEKPTGMSRSAPIRLEVPGIGIDSSIMEVGRLSDGSLETPPLFEHITGWYKDGPSPGQIGPSIIVGHVDTYKGPSIFWNLGRLILNDQIIVTRADGGVITYKVTALKQYDQANFPTQEVYGDTLGSELRLITCGGTYNKKQNRYTQNTVVFATIILPDKSKAIQKQVSDSLAKSTDNQILDILSTSKKE